MHLKKFEYREKAHFKKFISKSDSYIYTFIYSRFITCEVKHFKGVFVLILMIRYYTSWKSKIQYIKILEYLYLSFIKWPFLLYKFWVSLVLWNHNNGEHCWLGNGPKDNNNNNNNNNSFYLWAPFKTPKDTLQ